MSERLQRILKENAKFEKESPYNFCDRWCERCLHRKQVRCRLYLDEFERKATCIAHGKDEDDPEITKAVLEAQYKGIDEKLNEHIKKLGIDFDSPDIDEDEVDEEEKGEFEDLPSEIQRHIRFVENSPVEATAKSYFDKAHAFLEGTFYKNEHVRSESKYDFETVAWYYTLLPAKLHRALCGFHEPTHEDEFGLYDAVAQFQICKKGTQESIQALRKIREHFPSRRLQVAELIALLHNIDSRIEVLLESI